MLKEGVSKKFGIEDELKSRHFFDFLRQRLRDTVAIADESARSDGTVTISACRIAPSTTMAERELPLNDEGRALFVRTVGMLRSAR